MATVNTKAPVITLTSDFGMRDNYSGIVKGILLYLNPRARIVDLACDVPPFNIESGRYLLETSYRNFPPGTIHLAIIDPGVGTRRKSIVLETEDYFFVGPDNGLFSFLERKQLKKIVSITKKKFFLKDVSPTFHGRDVFAPIAAYLSLGVLPDEFGPKIRSMARPRAFKVRKVKRNLIGKVVYIDRFGNLATSFKREDLPKRKSTVYLNDEKIGRPLKTFGMVKEGQPVCYINSFGYLEIAVNRGSAAEYFNIDYSSDAKILIAPL